MDALPKPGEVLREDYRRPAPSMGATTAGPHSKPTLRLVQWNIERGLQLQGIIDQLRALDADVIALQEVDIGCERSGRVDTGAAVAHALGYLYLFLCEFEELRSPARDPSAQGGGVHGNAILSRHDVLGCSVVEHSHHPVDWNDPLHPRAQREPRRGRRLTLAADVATPLGAVRVYSCHLEVFCGMLSRMRQFADILVDAKQAAAAAAAAAAASAALPPPPPPQQQQQQVALPHTGAPMQPAAGAQHPALGGGGGGGGAQPARCAPMQAILGDLNTMAHGIARLSPDYCCDAMRWGSLGLTEAEFWQRHLLSYYVPWPGQGPPAPAAPASMEDGSGGGGGGGGSSSVDPRLRPYLSPKLLQLGLPDEVCAALLNPGFSDPFDVAADETLDNPRYRVAGVSLMKGKLDWMLLRGLHVVGRGIGNHDYGASDHKLLFVDVR